ncbi:MAG: transposase [Thermodesulfobacteriota bacterium]|nr:transposase [Thermodesulfobacteriota bacterium]
MASPVQCLDKAVDRNPKIIVVSLHPGIRLIRRTGQSRYQSKNGRERKVFPALNWLAQLTTHIPDRSEHMVRYYGYYSNKNRGQRKKADQDDDIVNIIETDLSNKALRKSWARPKQDQQDNWLLLYWFFQEPPCLSSLLSYPFLFPKIRDARSAAEKENPPKGDYAEQ